MGIKIALAGNPNCGKTTLFNALTGSSQYVGNWPGVTVEKKEGKLTGHKDVQVVDLPGIYSLSPYTLEEVVSRSYLLNEQPDAIINIIDATNLERNLYLTTQLLEVGLPVVVALNMMDLVRKNGDKIDTKKLEKTLGCPVIEISALKNQGTKELIEQAIDAASVHKLQNRMQAPLPADVEQAVEAFNVMAQGKPGVTMDNIRWYGIKLFERDEKVMQQLGLSEEVINQIEQRIKQVEDANDDDAESLITAARYDEIATIISGCYQKARQGGMSISDKIDSVVTNRILALPIFALIMWGVYYLSISTVGTMGTDWVNDVLFGEIIPPAVENFLVSVNCADWLQSLILDGIIGGVGAVLGFLPQMLVLFFCLAILEDCGYMARIAFIMDRIFRKFGLSGKSFIPILVGTGCGVPGIMASRTIENDRDRKMTIIVTTFIPCGAKLPIIALIAGALFPESTWVGPSAYFVGIAAIILSGIILKKTSLFVGDPAPFVMELPAYHIPGAKGVLIHMWDRAKSFVRKAGTVIFVACAVIWFMQTFNWQLQMVEESESILASIGNVIAPLFAPLGWGEWRAAVAAVTGLVAKENVVGTFGVLYGFAEVAEDGAEVWGNLQTAFTQVSAYSFLVFNLLCAPCFAAIGAIKREMGNWKWTLIAVGYQTGFAYIVAFIIQQLGSVLVLDQPFGVGAVLAIVLVIALLWLLVRKPSAVRGSNRLAVEMK